MDSSWYSSFIFDDRVLKGLHVAVVARWPAVVKVIKYGASCRVLCVVWTVGCDQYF